mmetsp:Transcript_80069/g.166537  ORF Transcript_80069/g.166537 Transcript_80069/m.166537 type:complete len:751 (+) Transcript_80069:2-2254(+)
MILAKVGDLHYLHTGDCRATPKLIADVKRRGLPKIHTLFLDTTYASSKSSFADQNEVIERVAQDLGQLPATTLVLVGAYTIGKERVIFRLARQLNCKIYLPNGRKKSIYACLDIDDEDNARFTDDPLAAQIHVVPLSFCGEMWPFFKPNYEKCEEHLSKHPCFNAVVGVIPTGHANASNWNRKHEVVNKGRVTIRLYAYSEHSSAQELQNLVRLVKPVKLVPTVFRDKKDQTNIHRRFHHLLDKAGAARQLFASAKKASFDNKKEEPKDPSPEAPEPEEPAWKKPKLAPAKSQEQFFEGTFEPSKGHEGRLVKGNFGLTDDVVDDVGRFGLGAASVKGEVEEDGRSAALEVERSAEQASPNMIAIEDEDDEDENEDDDDDDNDEEEDEEERDESRQQKQQQQQQHQHSFEESCLTVGGSSASNSIPTNSSSRSQGAAAAAAAASSAAFSSSSASKAAPAEVQNVLEDILPFDMCAEDVEPTDHSFASTPASSSKSLMTAVRREMVMLKKGLLDGSEGVPAPIIIRTYNSRSDLYRAMVVGPPGTPYADVPFFFDFGLPPEYPRVPPTAHFHAHYVGPERLNPNLYIDGKVCLSLLGTWSGPSWVPGVSTMLQVLVSLQGLVLVEEPYYNEPGHESDAGTTQGKQASSLYNEHARICSVRAALNLHQMPPKGFEQIVDAYFKKVGHKILRDCEEVIKPDREPRPSNGFRQVMGKLLPRLREKWGDSATPSACAGTSGPSSSAAAAPAVASS